MHYLVSELGRDEQQSNEHPEEDSLYGEFDSLECDVE